MQNICSSNYPFAKTSLTGQKPFEHKLLIARPSSRRLARVHCLTSHTFHSLHQSPHVYYFVVSIVLVCCSRPSPCLKTCRHNSTNRHLFVLFTLTESMFRLRLWNSTGTSTYHYSIKISILILLVQF